VVVQKRLPIEHQEHDHRDSHAEGETGDVPLKSPQQ